MKQLLKLLWDPTTHELMVLVGALGVVVNVLLPGATGTYREVLTAAAAIVAAAGGISDAVVQHAANIAAAVVKGAELHTKAAAHAAAGDAAAASAMNTLGSILGGQPSATFTPPQTAGPTVQVVTPGPQT